MLWSRKPASVHERTKAVGLDVTASRVRAVAAAGGSARPLVLDDPAEELALFIACDRRSAEVGRAGLALCRKLPHAVCSNFLPALAQQPAREWRGGRHTLTPESALELAFSKIQRPVAAESDSAALVLPAYLAPSQVAKAVVVATRVKLPLKGTASIPLAVAADRAAAILTGRPLPDAAPAEWVVPIRPAAAGPGCVVVVDADEFALSAAVVAIERENARLVASGCWPRAGVKLWKDRLLDAVADRCVRVCRRDPRDSADAEQALFDQLDDALERAKAGQRASLTVRTAHWFQDLAFQPEEFEAVCANLARPSAEAVRELAAGAGLAVPPRAVWLTHAAGRLPGLAKAVHQNTPEGTAVEVLPPNAVGQAAAALAPRWAAGELARTHLDAVVKLPPIAVAQPAEKPKSTGRR